MNFIVSIQPRLLNIFFISVSASKTTTTKQNGHGSFKRNNSKEYMQQISQDEDDYFDDSYQSDYSEEEIDDSIVEQYDDGLTSEDPFDLLLSQQKRLTLEKQQLAQFRQQQNKQSKKNKLNKSRSNMSIEEKVKLRDLELERTAVTELVFKEKELTPLELKLQKKLKKKEENKAKKVQQEEEMNKKKAMTPAQIAKTISPTVIREAISKAIGLYASQVLLQLKEFAGWLESYFILTKWPSDFIYSNFSSPLDYLLPESQAVIVEWVKFLDAAPIADMVLFILRIIYTESGDERKPGFYTGLRIFLQLLLRTRADAVAQTVANVNKNWKMTGKSLENMIWIVQQFIENSTAHPDTVLAAISNTCLSVLMTEKSTEEEKQQVKTSLSDQLERYKEEEFLASEMQPVSVPTLLTFLDYVYSSRETMEKYQTVLQRLEDVAVFHSVESMQLFFKPLFEKLIEKTKTEIEKDSLEDESRMDIVQILSRILLHSTSFASLPKGKAKKKEWTEQEIANVLESTLFPQFKLWIAEQPTAAVEVLSYLHFQIFVESNTFSREQLQVLYLFVTSISKDKQIMKNMECEQRIIVMEKALEEEVAKKDPNRKQSFARYIIKRAVAMFFITMVVLMLILYMFGRACFMPNPDQKLAILREDERFQLFCSRLGFLTRIFQS